MGEPAQMQQTADELVDGLLTNVKAEVLYKVWNSLRETLPGVTFERLEAQYDEDDDVVYFECPHCLESYDYSHVRAIDVQLRRVDAYETDSDILRFDMDADGDGWDDLVFACGKCGHAVSLPRDWEAEWN